MISRTITIWEFEIMFIVSTNFSDVWSTDVWTIPLKSDFDDSQYELGAIIPFLSRQRTKKVIAFVSRIFNKIRLNYSQVDKEILTLTKFHLCLLVNSLAHFYWKFCYNFNYNFLGSVFWSNGLVVKALDSQSRGPMFKTRLAPR